MDATKLAELNQLINHVDNATENASVTNKQIAKSLSLQKELLVGVNTDVVSNTTKLATVETGAQKNQTIAQIKTGIGTASSSANGLMSSTDKTKLDGMEDKLINKMRGMGDYVPNIDPIYFLGTYSSTDAVDDLNQDLDNMHSTTSNDTFVSALGSLKKIPVGLVNITLQGSSIILHNQVIAYAADIWAQYAVGAEPIDGGSGIKAGFGISARLCYNGSWQNWTNLIK